MKTALLSRLGAWLILATICVNYLGASYELVWGLALLGITLSALPWRSYEIIGDALLFFALFTLLTFLPAALWNEVSPALKLIIASGILLLLVSVGNGLRSILLSRLSRVARQRATPPPSTPLSEQ